jgi:glutathione S-transferase
MQLIGMLDSPYVRRVAIALILAKTPFIHRPISLFRHIDQFSKLNPLLKAPTLLTDDGAALMDSSVILEYLAGVEPRIAALTPSRAGQRLAALRATGLALTVMEKAVQRHYERMLRPAEKRHEPWVDRVTGQLTAGLSALDAELPGSGWIGGEFGHCRCFRRLRLRLRPVRSGRHRGREPLPKPRGVLRPRRSPAGLSRRSAGGWGDGLPGRG